MHEITRTTEALPVEVMPTLTLGDSLELTGQCLKALGAQIEREARELEEFLAEFRK